MLKNVYEGLNAPPKVYFSKEFFCKMYPTCVSSKLCEFIRKGLPSSCFTKVAGGTDAGQLSPSSTSFETLCKQQENSSQDFHPQTFLDNDGQKPRDNN